MRKRTVAIVQARMGSQRFPGKMMADLAGRPLIDWVLRRSARAGKIDEVVLATTDLAQDDVLEEAALEAGVPVYRGSSADVLGRYAAAARRHAAEVVVRICADRPLVDAEILDLAVQTFRDLSPDLAFNHISDNGVNWPRGFGAEVLSAEQLYWLADNTTEQQHREHVTLYLWQHRPEYRIVPAPCPPELDPGEPDVLFDVDRPEDLDKLRALCAGLDHSARAADIISRWRQMKGAQA